MKKLIKILLRLYRRICQYRIEAHDAEKIRKVIELNNKGWFFIFAAIFSNLIATIFIVLLILMEVIPFDRNQLMSFVKAYIGLETAACTLLGLIFLSGKRFFSSLFGPIAIIIVFYGYYFFLALFAGREAGIQYVLLLPFPVSLMINTRHRTVKLLFFSFMFVVTILSFYMVNIIPPLYPLPAVIVDIIFYLVIFFLVTYTAVVAYFTIWHYNYIDVCIELMNRLMNFGSHHYSTEKEIKGNRLSNQLFLSFIFITILNFIAVTVIIIKAVNINFERYIYFTIVFYPAWFFSIFSLACCYYFKNKKGRNLISELLAITILGSIFIFVSIITGSGAGIHYLLTIFIVLPVFINTDSRILKAATAGVFFIVFLLLMLADISGVFPLPAVIERQARNICTYFVVASFILAAVFSWFRFDCTARVMKQWDRYTERGFHLFGSESEKRLRKIQSSVMLIFLVMTVFCMFVVLGLALHIFFFLQKDAGYVISLLIYYGSTTFLMGFILFITLYFQEKTRTIIPAFLSFLPAVIWHLFMGVSLSQETLFAYFKIILLPIPFIALNRRIPSQRVLMISGMALIVMSIIANAAFHFLYEPLFPIPAYYDFAIGASVVFTITITLVLMAYYFYKQTSFAEYNLEKEKKKSELLLLNVLPEEIADELKRDGSSRPVRFEKATVMFTDFCGFSGLTESMTPEQLIEELDFCFLKFDRITERHNLEKMKTVGLTYMCAAGIPRSNNSNARDCVLAAIEMTEFINKIKSEKTGQSGNNWDVRVGINTGPVVAGVIGEKKFAYDIWGDTVNVASRILTTGLPGKINISKSTFTDVQEFFMCEYRGKVLAKNKGEIDQYYVRTGE